MTTCCRKPECELCNQCTYCVCNCWKCRECLRKYRPSKAGKLPVCNKCNSCRKCCECRGCPKFATDKTLHTGSIPSRSLITQLPRTIGIELEMAKWGTLSVRGDTPIPGIRYTVAHDWSVKPSEQEMVLAPLRGDALVQGMLELSRAATVSQVELNETCALHVHVGAKDLSYFEIRRLLEVYSRIEPQIYSNLIVPHRRKLPSIHYCQMMTEAHLATGCDRCVRYATQYPGQRHTPEPLETVLHRMWLARTTEDLKVCMLRMLYGLENPTNFPETVASRKGGHYEFCRYYGLNLHSWMHRLTVEWRMKEATVDPWEMVMWPLWCGWVTHLATRLTDTEARSDKMSVRYLTDRWLPKYFSPWLEKHGL